MITKNIIDIINISYLIKMEELLKEIYYNPKTGLLSKTKFKLKINKSNPEIKNKDIEKFLAKQELVQVNGKSQFKGFFKIVAEPFFFQMDIFFISGKSLFILIEIASRKMFIYPIIGRRTQENIILLIEKFKKKVKTIKGLSGDDEFSASKIVKYCDDNNILLSTNIAAEDHINKGNFLGIVDAATRTIKSYIRNYKIANDTNVFMSELSNLILNYNNTPHSSLENKTPNEVWDDPEFKEQQLNDGLEHNNNLSEKINLKIGDYVRKKTELSGMIRKNRNSQTKYTLFMIKLEINSFFKMRMK
jgi:hypothetical protein